MTETQTIQTQTTETQATDPQLTKRLVIGGQQWGIADAGAEDVVQLVRDAMTDGTRVELPLCDHTGHAVTVFLNGAVTPSVELDLLRGPRPSEMS